MIKKEKNIFSLHTLNTSYIMRVSEKGHLEHLHYGARIHQKHFDTLQPIVRKPWSGHPDNDGSDYTLESMLLEYPVFGQTDYRLPALTLAAPYNNLNLVFDDFDILEDKVMLDGLPCGSNAPTLHIHLVDKHMKLKVTLMYSVYEKEDVITRAVRISNLTEHNIHIEKIMSTSIDFRDKDYEMIHLSGTWARERHVVKRKLVQGIQGIESNRGNSSHQHNPFVCLARKGTTEDFGDAYGCSLVYSGNFKAEIEVDAFEQTRLNMGIHPDHFTFEVKPNESFDSPEAVMTYSYKGLNGMSQNCHAFIKNRILRGKYKHQPRPVLLNNWEATYFDFTEEKLLALADKAAQVGVELFVLDDGWFGERNNDQTSLGDWFVNMKKIPKGIDGLSKAINEKGLKFGLWVEPEMVSPKSILYQNHPEWCLHAGDRTRSECRNQLILDYSKLEVQEYIIHHLTEIFKSGNIEYVKWDMNRSVTEVGSTLYHHGEVLHRFILGLYQVMKVLTERFPNILFEGCAGGGGRFDMGILYYMPQIWTSDDTDAYERIKIQHGTSFMYPQVTMGSHVSAVPNHQVDRFTSLSSRYHTAIFGNLGYELDLTSLTEEDLQIIKAQIGAYKSVRSELQYGTFYRLISPFEGNFAAWQISGEQNVYVYYSRGIASPNDSIRYIKLKDLKPKTAYSLNGEVYTGDYLMHIGITVLPKKGDYGTEFYQLNILD